MLSCAYIVVSVTSNPYYRARLYHRLMLGVAVTMMFHMAFKLWGTAAVPADTEGVFGASGTTQTCTALGFVNQLGFVSIFYYMELSIVSFVAAVRYDFSFPNYMEQWCHVGAFAFPLVSSIYLTAIEAFNFTGYTCWVASLPWGCGGDSGIACQRGPDNITTIYWLFAAAPTFLVLLLPTFLMVALNVYVRRRKLPRGAKTAVFYQSGIYLIAIYFAVIPSFVDYGVYVVAGKEVFWLRMLAICQRQLMGFYILLAYLRLRIVQSPSSSSASSSSKEGGGGGGGRTSFTRRDKKVTDEDGTIDNTRDGADRNDSANITLAFSIFDGTADPSSPWSDFIFDGEEDEQDIDDLESRQWECVVQR
jgi:hypothetical protein